MELYPFVTCFFHLTVYQKHHPMLLNIDLLSLLMWDIISFVELLVEWL